MQGIPFFQYKCLREDLERIREQSALMQLPEQHLNDIVEHKNKLNEVYAHYEATVQKLSSIIEEYQKHRMAIRRLVIIDKRNKRQLKKNASQLKEMTGNITVS